MIAPVTINTIPIPEVCVADSNVVSASIAVIKKDEVEASSDNCEKIEKTRPCMLGGILS